MTDRTGIFFQIILKKVKNLNPSPQNDRAPKPIKAAFTSISRSLPKVLARPFAELTALLPQGTSFGRSDITSSVAMFRLYPPGQPFAVLSALPRTFRPRSLRFACTLRGSRSQCSRHFLGHFVLGRCASLVPFTVKQQ